MLTAKKETFIQFMIAADVLRFGNFRTKSGRLSPYFINTGNYKTGAQISTLGAYYASLVTTVCGSHFDAIFGPAYKGIPLATATAFALYEQHKMDKPYFFNRKEAKDHGEGGTLIGYQPADGDRILIIEDVLTAGTAMRETLPLLQKAANVQVTDLFISVNRCEQGLNGTQTAAMELKQNFGINVHAIVTVADIYEYLKKREDVSLAVQMEDYMARYCLFDTP